jgi:hypothetical protein
MCVSLMGLPKGQETFEGLSNDEQASNQLRLPAEWPRCLDLPALRMSAVFSLALAIKPLLSV